MIIACLKWHSSCISYFELKLMLKYQKHAGSDPSGHQQRTAQIINRHMPRCNPCINYGCRVKQKAGCQQVKTDFEKMFLFHEKIVKVSARADQIKERCDKR